MLKVLSATFVFDSRAGLAVRMYLRKEDNEQTIIFFKMDTEYDRLCLKRIFEEVGTTQLTQLVGKELPVFIFGKLYK